MQNQAAVEALYSGTFVENYLDVIENMPNEIQRFVSRIRECDLIIYRVNRRRNPIILGPAHDLFANIDDLTDDFQKASSNPQAQRAVLAQIQKGLIVAQDVGDEKLALAQAMADLVESKNRFLESSAENLDFERDEREHTAQLRRTATGADGVGAAGGRENTAGGRSTALGSGGTGHNSPAGHHAAGVAGGKGAMGAGVKTKSVKRRKKQERHAASKGGDLTEDDGEPPHKMATTGGGSASGGSGKGGSRGGKRPVSSSNHSGSGSNPSGTNSSGKKKAGSGGSGGGKRGGGGSGGGGGGGGFNQNNDDSDPEIDPSLDNIDPDEPTYCLCEQISYGEMIGCDNDLCPLEWFHFNCVNLSSKPKGKWFCPKCRGEKANVMKPKAQFIRELERFNKEREEKNAGSHKH
ncbi:hypothetical protein TCAL_05152 [Tigriopus californicus]|uniref:Inhibitor of growth protein n=1 Tax=Tigriopus californicus TaxID=6832 RepID=A0A553NNW4_TIGCA|nr:hypothetical protein TCAL_05152 [Tigriopus californicus]|eukprot:TCALIF_05152-PA protein Name:"Similar to Ing1 Inhibitor of growth protein 1 (Mus musculus)" AED:0.08 eAED:0.08 QI:0/0.33/0.5/1/0.66/0.75/4/201/406